MATRITWEVLHVTLWWKLWKRVTSIISLQFKNWNWQLYAKKKKCIDRDTVMYKSTSGKIQFSCLQSLLHTTLQNILWKVQHQGETMDSLLRIFSKNSWVWGLQKDDSMAFNTSEEMLIGEFLKYIEASKLSWVWVFHWKIILSARFYWRL